MSWVRVDDQFAEHPKVLALGRDRLPAVGLWLHGLTYANRYLTGGFVPDGALPPRSDKLASRLEEVGLWERVPDGYRIHDYGDYQPDRDEVLALRAIRAEAGRKGGLRSASKREANASSTALANAEAPANARLQANAKQTSTPSRPGPVPPVEVEVGTEVPTASAPAIPSNPFVLYRDLTGVNLAGRAEAWLNDYIRQRGPERVAAALRTAWAADPAAEGLLERLRPLLNGTPIKVPPVMTDEAQLDAFQADPRWIEGRFEPEELPLGPIRDAYVRRRSLPAAQPRRDDPAYLDRLRRWAGSKDAQIAASAQLELAELMGAEQ